MNLPQRSLFAFCLLISTLIVTTLLFALWQWRDDWELANQNVTESPVMIQSDKSANIIAAIPNEHLFGKSLSKNANMPISNLQLRVTGIVKFNDQDANSKAYISISGQPSKIYQIGDNLPYGVKIYAISSDSVILENDGHLEKLPLPRTMLHFKSRTTNEENRD